MQISSRCTMNVVYLDEKLNTYSVKMAFFIVSSKKSSKFAKKLHNYNHFITN